MTPAAKGRATAAASDEAGVATPEPARTSAAEPAYEASAEDETPPTYAQDLREAAVELWRFREMLYQLTLRDVRIRYKQAVIGFGWALLMPALVVISGCLVRYAMSRTTRTPLDLAGIASISVKALPWSFFVGTISFATQSLTGNLQLVSKVYFPRAVLPLAATLGQAFDAIIGAVVLALVLPFLGVHLSTALLWVPVLTLLLFLLTVAASLFLSCANLFFRDVKYIVQVMLTFGIFFTPVFFDPAMMGHRLARLIMLNPLSPLLEGLRLAVVEQHNLLLPLVASDGAVIWSPAYLVYATLWALLGLGASAMIFHRSEFVFAEYI
ncbi:MAG: type transporter [Gemmatimonadetes bacterium]|jgi:lipopolysaccharide transport system permease protein|nr:type transporter [Gemmatimonadota bacterium]